MSQLTKSNNSPLARFAEKFEIDPQVMEQTLKSTVFKQSGNQEITNEQMVALMIVAEQHNLNPFTKEIYAFPDKQGGIVPVVGIDGWSRLINSHKQFDGMEFEYADNVIKMDDNAKNCPEWIECIIYRKDRSKPVRIREDLDEVYRPAFMKGNYPILGPWQTHTKRMTRHKAVIQCARLAFGFAGIYDEDEAERIIEARNSDITDVEYTVGPNLDIEPAESQSKVEALKAKIQAAEQPQAAEEQAPELTEKDAHEMLQKISEAKNKTQLEDLAFGCSNFVGTEWHEDLRQAYSNKLGEIGSKRTRGKRKVPTV